MKKNCTFFRKPPLKINASQKTLLLLHFENPEFPLIKLNVTKCFEASPPVFCSISQSSNTHTNKTISVKTHKTKNGSTSEKGAQT